MNCDFHCLKTVECSCERKTLSDLSENEIDIILSSIGLVSEDVTRQFVLCSAHERYLDYTFHLRRKNVRCGVPAHLAQHTAGKTEPRGDRRINKTMLLKIQSCTGAVLPIGTAICTNCRKKLILPKCAGSKGTDVILEQTIENTEVESGRLSADHLDPNEPVVQNAASEQNEFDSEVSQFSQDTEASVCMMNNLEQLNMFLGLSNISPIKERRVALTESSERTRSRCIDKALQCLTAACETICPGEGNLLKSMVCKSIQQDIQAVTVNDTTRILIDVYYSAHTWAFRRQVLSILTESYTFQDLKQIIPELSSWQYYAANKHRSHLGCGMPLILERIPRSKIDKSQLDHFIDYITSSHVVKDLPYGMKTLKLTTGEVVEVPNLIRSLAPASLISQYTSYCREERLPHLGTSTLYNILNDCSALVRKSIEGLDYYVAEGGRAFSDVEEMVDQLNLPEEKIKDLKTKLLNSKRYIKSDFKVHIQTESTVADHCICYALSDVENDFLQKCNHDHSNSCKQCIGVSEVFEEIRLNLEKKTWENKDAIMFKVSQDGHVTASLICDVVKDLERMLPEVREIHLFSDNAGCYKNTQAMLVLQSQLGQRLQNYNFNEAQDGKGPCDRRASHLKSCIKRYINEGNNVTTAEEMKVAIDAKQNGAYRVRVVDIATDVDRKKENFKPLPSISQLHNFSFEEKGIRVWKAYGIGKGKLIQWERIGKINNRCDLVIHRDWSESHFQTLDGEVMDSREIQENDETPSKKRKVDYAEYGCSKEGCMRIFKTARALEHHITLGNCDYKMERHSLHDEAKLRYSERVNKLPLVHNIISKESEKELGKCSNLQQGWALRHKKKKSIFSCKQVNFMKEKFEGGKKSGRKTDPFTAAEEMRMLKSADQFVFRKEEYLTGQQISSFFSRLSLKDRKTNMEDFVAAKHEADEEIFTQDILNAVSV